MKQVFVLSGVCAGLLFGCSSVRVPEYQRPEAPAKATFSGPPAGTPTAVQAISPQWWTQFGDPELNSLVDKAIAGNFDLRSLAARISVAQAQIAEARSGSQPSADLAAGSSFQKTTGSALGKEFSVGTQVSWDLDIWGKTQKGVQGQTAEFHATEADWRAGYLQIVASVSMTYFQILQLDEQIAQQQQALAKNQQILVIDETMSSNGLIPGTDVLRQRAEINRLTKDLLELRRNRDVGGERARHPGRRTRRRIQDPGVPAGGSRADPGRARRLASGSAVPPSRRRRRRIPGVGGS